MRRPRGPGGRFLTAAEIAEMRAKEGTEGRGEDHVHENGTQEATASEEL